MDPNATVNLIADALDDGDWEGAHQSLTDLRDWIRGGGSPPDQMHQTALLSALKAHFSMKHEW